MDEWNEVGSKSSLKGKREKQRENLASRSWGASYVSQSPATNGVRPGEAPAWHQTGYITKLYRGMDKELHKISFPGSF